MFVYKKIGIALAIIIVALLAVFFNQAARTPDMDSNPSLDEISNKDQLGILSEAPNEIVGAPNPVNFSVIATSVADGKAVILTSQASTHVVSVGDGILNTELEVAQISENKVVLNGEQKDELYFVYLSEGDKPSRVQKISNKLNIDSTLIARPGKDSDDIGKNQ